MITHTGCNSSVVIEGKYKQYRNDVELVEAMNSKIVFVSEYTAGQVGTSG